MRAGRPIAVFAVSWVAAACGGAPPERPPPDAVSAAPPIPRRCDVRDDLFPVKASGHVVDIEGQPVAGIPVQTWDTEARAWTTRTRTDAEGAWEVLSPDAPATLRVGGWATTPASLCAGVPAGADFEVPEGVAMGHLFEGLDVVSPPVCPWRVEVPGVDGAVEVVIRHGIAQDVVPAEAQAGVVQTPLPCDVHAMAVLGTTHGTTWGPLDGLHPVTPGATAVALPTTELQPVHVQAPTKDAGAWLSDDLRSVALDAGVGALGMAPGARWIVRSPGSLPAWGDVSDHAVRVEVDPVAAREVTVACLGLESSRCPTEAVCTGLEGLGGAACHRDRARQLRCPCAEGPSVVIGPGWRASVGTGEDDDVVAADFGVLPGRVVGACPPEGRVTGGRRPARFGSGPRFSEFDARCGLDGRFDSGPIPDGTWDVRLSAPGVRTTRAVVVAGGVAEVSGWTEDAR